MNLTAGLGDIDGIGSEPADDAIIMRQSTVGSMDLCPAREGYRLQGVRQIPSEAMTFGTMIHSFAEQRLMGLSRVVTADDLESWWVEAVAKDGHDLHDLAAPDVVAAGVQEALQACAAWDKAVRPHVDREGAGDPEVSMLAPIGTTPRGREVWLQGTADYVTATRIFDWKTAGRGWKESKAHSTGQASAYTFLAEATGRGLIPDHTYWVWNRQAYTWNHWDTHREPEHVTAWLAHAFMRALEIENGAFPFTPWASTFGDFKRGWWCSAKYCSAWDVCEGKYLNDDVWEGQVVQITVGWE